MSQKLWGILVCGQLWILYPKINFEVIYFIQFSIFLKKNKTIGCRLFIATSWPSEFSFFNSKINFLTMEYFEQFSTSFYYYFFSICYTVPNDLNSFKHVANLPWRMNPRNNHHFGYFFIQMWPCEVHFKILLGDTNVTLWRPDQFFARPPKGFLSIQTLTSCNPHSGKFWNFFYIFSNQHNIRSYNYISPKMFFFPKFGTCPQNGNFWAFFGENIVKELKGLVSENEMC